jgi:hypothetical protein
MSSLSYVNRPQQKSSSLAVSAHDIADSHTTSTARDTPGTFTGAGTAV